MPLEHVDVISGQIQGPLLSPKGHFAHEPRVVSKARPNALLESCGVVMGPHLNVISMNFYSCRGLTHDKIK